MGPETVEPSPYSISNVPLFLELVDESAASYLLFELHVELLQEDEGTQRSEEPVSKSMRKLWPGVPIEIVPAHSSSSSSSVSDSLWRFARRSGRTASGLISAPSLKACVPTFFWRLIRFWRCLLGLGNDVSPRGVRGKGAGSVLGRLDGLDLRPVGVEGAVGVGERRALLERDGDALLGGGDGSRGRHEGEGNGDEGSLAEHDGNEQLRANELGTGEH